MATSLGKGTGIMDACRVRIVRKVEGGRFEGFPSSHERRGWKWSLEWNVGQWQKGRPCGGNLHRGSGELRTVSAGTVTWNPVTEEHNTEPSNVFQTFLSPLTKFLIVILLLLFIVSYC